MGTFTRNRSDLKYLMQGEREVMEFAHRAATDEVSAAVVPDVETPEVWVAFIDRDEVFDDADIQIETDGWEIVELTDRDPSLNMFGCVSTITGLTVAMVDHMFTNPGVYALVEVQGVASDLLAATGVSDRVVGDVLMRRTVA